MLYARKIMKISGSMINPYSLKDEVIEEEFKH
jgi:hypothetical protein